MAAGLRRSWSATEGDDRWPLRTPTTTGFGSGATTATGTPSTGRTRSGRPTNQLGLPGGASAGSATARRAPARTSATGMTGCWRWRARRGSSPGVGRREPAGSWGRRRSGCVPADPPLRLRRNGNGTHPHQRSAGWLFAVRLPPLPAGGGRGAGPLPDVRSRLQRARADEEEPVMPAPRLTDADFDSRVTVDPDSGCHLYSGPFNSSGYGQFGRSERAHRYSYERSRGPIPDGLELDHLCRVRRCVNPAHLEPVTHAENMRRARRETCMNGHPWGPNTRIRKDTGSRVCRTCKTDNERRRRAERRPERKPSTHCKRGHALTPENTWIRHKGDRTSRVCRVCRRIRDSRRSATEAARRTS